MTQLVWHIDRAKFEFENVTDIDEWKNNPKVFFEFFPSSADEPGDDLFEAAVTEDDGGEWIII